MRDVRRCRAGGRMRRPENAHTGTCAPEKQGDFRVGSIVRARVVPRRARRISKPPIAVRARERTAKQAVTDEERRQSGAQLARMARCIGEGGHRGRDSCTVRPMTPWNASRSGIPLVIAPLPEDSKESSAHHTRFFKPCCPRRQRNWS
jgi:hypothetical protein